MMTNWDKRFMDLAKHVSYWSKDPSTKVGAVIVRSDNTIASVGYNGLPRGVEDSVDKLQDRNYKLPRTVHAELNAILNTKEPLDGYTIYVYPLPPCSQCAAAIIQSGIKRVVSQQCDNERWQESCTISNEMFEQVDIKLRLY